MRCKQKIYHE